VWGFPALLIIFSVVAFSLGVRGFPASVVDYLCGDFIFLGCGASPLIYPLISVVAFSLGCAASLPFELSISVVILFVCISLFHLHKNSRPDILLTYGPSSPI
jgi:hypothetical protein